MSQTTENSEHDPQHTSVQFIAHATLGFIPSRRVATTLTLLEGFFHTAFADASLCAAEDASPSNSQIYDWRQ